LSAANTFDYFVEQQSKNTSVGSWLNNQLLIFSWWFRIHSLLSPTEKTWTQGQQ